MLQSVKPFWKIIFQHPISTRKRLHVIGRIIRWQLATRLLNWPVVVPFIGETTLIIRRGMKGATGNIYVGLLEFDDMAFTMHFLRSNDILADIGSNVGAYTILGAGVCGAQVISLEPIPHCATVQIHNIKINQLENLVTLHRCAAGASGGTVEMSEDMDTTNHVVSTEYTGTRIITEVVTIDELFSNRPPSLIKIDVEGYESHVLAGSPKTLENLACRAVIIETNGSGKKYGTEDCELDATLKSYGFTSVSYDPFSRTLTPKEPNQRGNTIYVKNASETREILKQAKSFKIFGMDI